MVPMLVVERRVVVRLAAKVVVGVVPGLDHRDADLMGDISTSSMKTNNLMILER